MKRIEIIAVLSTVSILLLSGCAAKKSEADFTEHGQSSLSSSNSSDSSQQSTSDSQRLPELNEQSELPDYLAYAALNNPGLEAAFYHWKAAVEVIPQAKTLPDPRFTYRYFIEQVETRVGAQKQAFSLSQTFPWFGKLDSRADAASEAANAARQQYEAAKLKLFFELKDAYYEYYYLWRAIETIKENIELVKNFESVARTRYKTTSGTHPDVIRIQVELGKLEDRLNSLQDLRSPTVARLNAVLNRPAAAPLPWPKHIEEEDIYLSDEQILELMVDSNPELKAMDSEIAKNRAKINLANKDYYPDITLGIDYIDTSDRTGPNPPKDNGQDPIIAKFSVNLPIWREKLDSALREAEYNHRVATWGKTQKLNSLNAQLKLALYRFHDGSRKADLYKNTLLPKAIESVKASQASFSAGKNSFLDLIDAQRVMLEFELSYERAISDKAQRLSEIEMLVGKEIPRKSESKSPEPAPTDKLQTQ